MVLTILVDGLLLIVSIQPDKHPHFPPLVKSFFLEVNGMEVKLFTKKQRKHTHKSPL